MATIDDCIPSQDALRAFIRQQRDRCLWFVRLDYEPEDTAAFLRALRHIERHGSRDAYVQARRFREWLSQGTSATSAGS